MNRILFMLALVFFTATAFTNQETTTNTQPDPAAFKLMEITYLWDLLKAGYEPDRDRDDTWLEVGFRSKYAMAKEYAALDIIESVFNEKVFLSGPHGSNMDFNSAISFGHYNPDFIATLGNTIGKIVENPIYKAAMQRVYSQHLKNMAKVHFDAYAYLVENEEYLALMKDKYATEINSGNLNINQFTEYFRPFADGEAQKGLDIYEGFNAPTFWLRRMMDGTAESMIKLQIAVMKEFDPDFSDEIGLEEMTAFREIIAEQLTARTPPTRTRPGTNGQNKPNNFSGDSGTFKDSRNGETYKWVRMKDNSIWMAENLNHKTAYSWCYNDEEKECEKNGRLYDATSSKDACPKGWHLSTDKEWQSLIDAYGGYDSKSNIIKDPKRAYIALLPGGVSGFNAKLEGHRNYNGKYVQKGIVTRFYASNGYSYEFSERTKIKRAKWEDTFGNHCRCVKD